MFFKESKIYDCYDRVPFSRDEYNADALAECENRGIFILRPQYPEYCSNSFGEGSKAIHILQVFDLNCSLLYSPEFQLDIREFFVNVG